MYTDFLYILPIYFIATSQQIMRDQVIVDLPCKKENTEIVESCVEWWCGTAVVHTHPHKPLKYWTPNLGFALSL